MIRLVGLLFALAICLVAAAGPAVAAGRAALVIGIDAYDEVEDLEKAVGDARAMAATLRALGFTVTEVLDADRRALSQAISTFAAALGDGDTAFVHFSGHGVEIDGENYLLPSDVPKPDAGQRDFVKAEAIAMSDLIGRIAERGARTRVFVIDACRDNPFAQDGVRSVGSTRGLARVEAPAGTFIMYSAGYRQRALDRLGPEDAEETSVYTRTLVRHLLAPGRAIADIAQDVRQEVEELARGIGHSQRPAYYDELSARLVLVAPDDTGGLAPGEPGPPSAPDDAQQVWAATKDTTSAAVLEAFIARFEGTIYGDLAAARLRELVETAAKETAAPESVVDLPAVGTWELLVPHNQGVARWIFGVRPEGTYWFRSDGPGAATSHQGTVSFRTGQWTLRSERGIDWKDAGTYQFPDADTLVLSGRLGTGVWRRIGAAAEEAHR